MQNLSIFSQMNGNWIRWTDYRIVNDYILPVENAGMEMYDAAAERTEMLAAALNCGRQLIKTDADAAEICLSFVRRFGLIGWMTALPTDIGFEREKNTYLRYEGYIAGGRLVDTREYISCFYPAGEGLRTAVAQMVGREPVYNFVFSSTYGEPMSWTAALFIQLYEHFCTAEEWRRNGDSGSSKKLKQRLDWRENMGLHIHMLQKNSLETVFEPDSLRSLLILTYAVAQSQESEQPPALKRCKHCGQVYYNENNRSEFCSVKCRNHYNVIAFRERNRK